MKNILLTSFLLLLLAGQSANAGVMIDFSVNTSPLVGNPAGPFYASFQFFDIGGGPANNGVTISNFSGAVGGTEIAGAGATGSLNSSLVLVDVDPMSITPGDPIGFIQRFTPGATLSFRMTFNDPIVADGDAFTFQILEDASGQLFPITTADPSTRDAFLTVDLDSVTTPSFETFGHSPSDPNYLALAAGPEITLDAGSANFVNNNNGVVPEPTSMLVFALMGTVVLVQRRNRRKSS